MLVIALSLASFSTSILFHTQGGLGFILHVSFEKYVVDALLEDKQPLTKN